MFLSVEGPEGAGKSTVAGRIHELLTRAGFRSVLTYEPGGTVLGQQIREIVLHGVSPLGPQRGAGQGGQSRGEAWPPTAARRTQAGRTQGEADAGQGPPEPSNMSAPLGPRTETLLFCAARAQLLDEVIRPHLQSGGVVICDRYADSTLAYQCYGRGLPLEPVRAVLDFTTGGLWPDLTVLLDVEVRQGLLRKTRLRDTGGADRFESQAVEFHERVRQGYLALAAADPQRWLVVDATQPFDRVLGSVWEQIGRRLKTIRA